MTVDDLLAHFGLQKDTELASVLHLSRGTVSKWRHNGIPYKQQAVFEISLGGDLKADLSPLESTAEIA